MSVKTKAIFLVSAVSMCGAAIAAESGKQFFNSIFRGHVSQERMR
jgi:hypothetical protein